MFLQAVFFFVFDGVDPDALDTRGWIAPDEIGGKGRDARGNHATGAFGGEHEIIDAVLRRLGVNERDELGVDPTGGGGFRANVGDDLGRLGAIEAGGDALNTVDHGAMRHGGIDVIGGNARSADRPAVGRVATNQRDGKKAKRQYPYWQSFIFHNSCYPRLSGGGS